jgi:hypothetical protein
MCVSPNSAYAFTPLNSVMVYPARASFLIEEVVVVSKTE